MALLDGELRAIEALVSARRYDEARASCADLVARHPKSRRARRLQAGIKYRFGDYAGAVNDADVVVRLAPREPDSYFTRGRYLLRRGSPGLAILDFTEVLRLSDLWRSDYYVEAAHAYRAEALIRCQRFAEARRDCARLRDGLTFWVDSLRSREQMLADCAAGETRPD